MSKGGCRFYLIWHPEGEQDGLWQRKDVGSWQLAIYVGLPNTFWNNLHTGSTVSLIVSTCVLLGQVALQRILPLNKTALLQHFEVAVL